MIIITGCLRSGTSCISGILSEQGVNFGTNILDENEHNPKGYYEDLKVKEINFNILKNEGKNILFNISPTKKLYQFREDDVGYFSKLDAVKDPLIVWTISSWKEFFGNFKLVLSKRNKESVIKSLTNFFPHVPFKNINYIYESYQTRIEELKLCFPNYHEVDFDSFKYDKVSTIKKLFNFLDIKYTNSSFHEDKITRF